MKFSKRQLIKAAKYSLAVGLVVPAVSAIIYMVSMAPAPIAFGAIMGLLTFTVYVRFPMNFLPCISTVLSNNTNRTWINCQLLKMVAEKHATSLD